MTLNNPSEEQTQADVRLKQILPPELKGNPGLKKYLNNTAAEYIAYIEDNHVKNKKLLEVYRICLQSLGQEEPAPAVSVISPKKSASPKVALLELPTSASSMSLFDRLTLAINQAIVCLTAGVCNETTRKKAERLRMRFVEAKSYKDIQLAHNLKSIEAVRLTIKSDFIDPLVGGEVFTRGVPNFKLSDTFRHELLEAISQSLFCTPSMLNDIMGQGASGIDWGVYMHFFQMDLLTTPDGFRVLVPIDKIGQYATALKDVHKELNVTYAYVQRDKLLDIIRTTTLQAFNDELYTKLLDNFLSFLGTEQDGKGGVRLTYDKLSIEYVRQARIIYDSGKPLTKDRISAVYRERYNEGMRNLSVATLGKIGLYCSGILWYSAPLKGIKTVIQECIAGNNYMVHWDNIMDALRTEKLDSYPVDTIRAYVTEICVPSNSDGNLFCHKEHTAQHPEHSWRSASKYGQSNYIVNLAVKLLQANKGTMPKAALRKALNKELAANDYNTSLTDSSIDICLNNGLFKATDDNSFKLNKRMLGSVDLRTIGFRGKKYTMQIISVAIDELRKRGGKVLFAELWPAIQQSLSGKVDIQLSRRLIKDALESEWANDILVENNSGNVEISLIV